MTTAERVRKYRSNRSADQREAEQASDRVRKFRTKSQKTPEEVSIARVRNAEIQAEKRRRDRVAGVNGPTVEIVNGASIVPFYSIGSMDIKCSNCGALHFQAERVQKKSTFNDCCRHGCFPRDIITWPDYPRELAKFFTGEYDRGKRRVFLDNIRGVNNTLAPGCFCAHSYKHKTPGVPSMRIYGQTYHTINEQIENQMDDKGKTYSIRLTNDIRNSATHGQLYMIDTQSARERIMSDVPRVDPAIVSAFHKYLLKYNDYVRGYLTMKEKQDEEDRTAKRADRRPKELKLLFSIDEKVTTPPVLCIL